MTQQRPTRANQERQGQERAVQERPRMTRWRPPELLTTPNLGGHVRCRWIVESVLGTPTPGQVTTAMREGYEPVHRDELGGDGLAFMSSPDGCVRQGGLILMKLPVDFCEQRKAYYQERSQSQLRGADELQGIEQGRKRYIEPVREDRGSFTMSNEMQQASS